MVIQQHVVNWSKMSNWQFQHTYDCSQNITRWISLSTSTQWNKKMHKVCWAKPSLLSVERKGKWMCEWCHTWTGLSSILNRRFNAPPRCPPLLRFMNTKRGLASSGRSQTMYFECPTPFWPPFSSWRLLVLPLLYVWWFPPLSLDRLPLRFLFRIWPRTEDAISLAPCVMELRIPAVKAFPPICFTFRGDKRSLL